MDELGRSSAHARRAAELEMEVTRLKGQLREANEETEGARERATRAEREAGAARQEAAEARGAAEDAARATSAARRMATALRTELRAQAARAAAETEGHRRALAGAGEEARAGFLAELAGRERESRLLERSLRRELAGVREMLRRTEVALARERNLRIRAEGEAGRRGRGRGGGGVMQEGKQQDGGSDGEDRHLQIDQEPRDRAWKPLWPEWGGDRGRERGAGGS